SAFSGLQVVQQQCIGSQDLCGLLRVREEPVVWRESNTEPEVGASARKLADQLKCRKTPDLHDARAHYCKASPVRRKTDSPNGRGVCPGKFDSPPVRIPNAPIAVFPSDGQPAAILRKATTPDFVGASNGLQ